jgi:hypothetical protein
VEADGTGAPAPVYSPAGQCSTASSFIGKCLGLPVASRAPAPTAAAAIRQSAWEKRGPVGGGLAPPAPGAPTLSKAERGETKALQQQGRGGLLVGLEPTPDLLNEAHSGAQVRPDLYTSWCMMV